MRLLLLRLSNGIQFSFKLPAKVIPLIQKAVFCSNIKNVAWVSFAYYLYLFAIIYWSNLLSYKVTQLENWRNATGWMEPAVFLPFAVSRRRTASTPPSLAGRWRDTAMRRAMTSTASSATPVPTVLSTRWSTWPTPTASSRRATTCPPLCPPSTRPRRRLMMTIRSRGTKLLRKTMMIDQESATYYQPQPQYERVIVGYRPRYQ